MSNRLQALFADQQEKKAPVVVVSNANAEQVMSLESQIALTELETDLIEVESSFEDIEQLKEIQQGLESVALIAVESLKDGGLKRQGGAMLAQATNAYTDRLGYSESIIPSVESFGGMGESMTATEISVESIKDRVKKIWEGIKKAIANAMAAVKSWFANLTATLPKLVKRAEALAKEAEALDGDPSMDKVTLPGGDANNLSINGNVAGKSDLLKEIDEMASTDFIGKPLGDALEGVVSHLEAVMALEVGKAEEADVTALNSKLSDVNKGVVENLAKYFSLQNALNDKGEATQLMGGYTLKFTNVDSGDKPTKVSFVKHSEFKAVDDKDREVPTLVKSDIVDVSNAVKAAAESLGEKGDKASKELTKRVEDVIKSAEKVAKDLEKLEDAEANSPVAKALMEAVNATSGLGSYVNASTAIASRMTKVLSSALNYNKASIGAYKAKKEEE